MVFLYKLLSVFPDSIVLFDLLKPTFNKPFEFFRFLTLASLHQQRLFNYRFNYDICIQYRSTYEIESSKSVSFDFGNKK
jgi:hypothetical protein